MSEVPKLCVKCEECGTTIGTPHLEGCSVWRAVLDEIRAVSEAHDQGEYREPPKVMDPRMFVDGCINELQRQIVELTERVTKLEERLGKLPARVWDRPRR